MNKSGEKKCWGNGFIISKEWLEKFDNDDTDMIDRWLHCLIRLLHRDIIRIEGLDIKEPEILIYGLIRNKGDDVEMVARGK